MPKNRAIEPSLEAINPFFTDVKSPQDGGDGTRPAT